MTHTNTRARQLQRRLMVYAALALLCMAAVATAAASIPLIAGMKRVEDALLLHAANSKAQMVGAWLRQHQHLAHDMSNAVGLKQELESLNRGFKTPAEVMPYVMDAIYGAMANAPEVVGITRLNDNQFPVASGGIPIPAEARHTVLEERTKIGVSPSIQLETKPCILFGIPLRSRDGAYLGSDVVAVKATELHALHLKGVTLGMYWASEPRWFWPPDTQDDDMAHDVRLWDRGLALALQGKNGMFTSGNRILAYAPVPDSSWALVLTADARALYAPVWGNVAAMLGYMLLVYIACLAGSFVLSRPLAEALLRQSD